MIRFVVQEFPAGDFLQKIDTEITTVQLSRQATKFELYSDAEQALISYQAIKGKEQFCPMMQIHKVWVHGNS